MQSLPRPRRALKISLALLLALHTTALSAGSVSQTITETRIKKLPIVVTPKKSVQVPDGSRIVIANIDGPCSEEVKTALMRRLTDNTNHSVITRDHLRQIVAEKEEHWKGDFDSRTAAKLGQLLGASLWLVGRVIYCDQTAGNDPELPHRAEFNVMAALQVIDLSTGKVLASSANSGSYTPRETSYLGFAAAIPVDPGPVSQENVIPEGTGPDETTPPETGPRNFLRRLRGKNNPAEILETAETMVGKVDQTKQILDDGSLSTTQKALQLFRNFIPAQSEGNSSIVTLPDGTTVELRPEPERFAILSAADALANGFADKLFARSLWESVEMWQDEPWKYSEALRFVQLGDCDLAVRYIERIASRELSVMGDQFVSRYLHNYGVSLLCANRVAEAREKLRAAYRISSSTSALRMLGLAAKIEEWDLVVEMDHQPEMRMLTKRTLEDGESFLTSDTP